MEVTVCPAHDDGCWSPIDMGTIQAWNAKQLEGLHLTPWPDQPKPPRAIDGTRALVEYRTYVAVRNSTGRRWPGIGSATTGVASGIAELGSSARRRLLVRG